MDPFHADKQECVSQLISISNVRSSQQDLAFLFAELDEIPVGQFLQKVKASLKASTTLWCISHCSQFCILPKLTKSVPLFQAKEFVKM